MARRGVEPKPEWAVIPGAVRQAVAEMLGAQVRRAVREWGGYTPSPTYRLRLADGRRAFLKAVGPPPYDFALRPLLGELDAYHELPALVGDWMPAFYGATEVDGWHVLLLEDLGPKSAPPWNAALLRAVCRSYADFHLATLGADLPEWLPGPGDQIMGAGRLWRAAESREWRQAVAGLAGVHKAEALRWLEAAVPRLAEASLSVATLGPPHALLHRDTRSDNLRWVDGRLRLLDWPWAGRGVAEYDLAAFAETVAVEGGAEPEQVLAWYAERASVRPQAVDGALASLAGFFADQAWRPEIPGMPRLRPFQRRQLAVTLAWAAQRLRLPAPRWAAAL